MQDIFIEYFKDKLVENEDSQHNLRNEFLITGIELPIKTGFLIIIIIKQLDQPTFYEKYNPKDYKKYFRDGSC